MVAQKTQVVEDVHQQEKWLKQNTGWCEPYGARIQMKACKYRKKTYPSGHCKSCRGLVPA